jgi:hypothetical protein
MIVALGEFPTQSMPRALQLTPQEIAFAFADETGRATFPPILTIDQLARLFQVSVRTAKHWIASGHFAGATTKIGKCRRIFRDRAVQIAFSRERTKSVSTNNNNDGGTKHA